MDLGFAWQAWHLVTWTFVLRGRRGPSATGLVARDARDARDAAVVLNGRRGTLRFAWQAWHLVTWTFVLRGRCGTSGTGLALVACHM